MANEIVKYRNEMNLIPMRNYNAAELDIFFAICSKLKDKGETTIELSFQELKKLINYKPTYNKRFVKDIDHMYEKMLQITYGDEHNGVLKRFVLFTGFVRDINKQTVRISVNPDLAYLINDIENQFTRFELEIFTNLNSYYAKTMFRLLKQFKSTGFYKVKIDDFKILMDTPDSYNMSRVSQRVLDPIVKELSPLYEYLHITKIKNGKTVTHLEFNFKEKEDIQVPLFTY